MHPPVFQTQILSIFFEGKTHTMTGDFNGNMRGIIPRSVEQIIEQVIEMRGNGWEIVVTMSMVRSSQKTQLIRTWMNLRTEWIE